MDKNSNEDLENSTNKKETQFDIVDANFPETVWKEDTEKYSPEIDNPDSKSSSGTWFHVSSTIHSKITKNVSESCGWKVVNSPVNRYLVLGNIGSLILVSLHSLNLQRSKGVFRRNLIDSQWRLNIAKLFTFNTALWLASYHSTKCLMKIARGGKNDMLNSFVGGFTAGSLSALATKSAPAVIISGFSVGFMFCYFEA